MELVQAYLERIEALNKSGPGLNAVTQINPAVMAEAQRADELRADGVVLGPAHGLPVLLKDLVDVKACTRRTATTRCGTPTRRTTPASSRSCARTASSSSARLACRSGRTASAASRRGSATSPARCSTPTTPTRTRAGPRRARGRQAPRLCRCSPSALTSGSIISPSGAQSLVGIRPTVGIVPAYGIGPISSSQDTAGPMDRTVANAAMHLQSMVGRDPKNEAGYAAVFGPNWQASIKRAPEEAPDYMSALDLDLVRGQRIGYNGTIEPGSPTALAFDALVAAGAIMVERPSIPVGDVPALPSGYQQHKAIDEYYRGLGPNAPINSLEEEVAVNQAESDQALKFGNQNHANAALA